ncbi:hypothetical protein GCM10009601_31780 [Streptomyces thermospinosisporus]|uniref:Uncharacterized protein n=1 Tax=Streptomyces thermospinosisporus TaxID=161482 RepID=A0ABP4JMH0_9ACTN
MAAFRRVDTRTDLARFTLDRVVAASDGRFLVAFDREQEILRLIDPGSGATHWRAGPTTRPDFVAVPKGELGRVFSGVEELPDISIAPLWPHSVLDYLKHPSVIGALFTR